LRIIGLRVNANPLFRAVRDFNSDGPAFTLNSPGTLLGEVSTCAVWPLEVEMYSFANWLGGGKSSRSESPKRYRRIGFDQLEGRELLTSAPIPSLISIDLTQFVQKVVQEMGTSPAATSMDAGEIVDSGTSDIVPAEDLSSSEGEPTESDVDQSPMESEASPPSLYDFDWYSEDNLYTFTGFVFDNGDPFELTIYFGGLISGATCWVDYDGHFSFTIQLDDPVGVVTAIVQDGEGLWSNEASVYI
jgi:hypothetical protein